MKLFRRMFHGDFHGSRYAAVDGDTAGLLEKSPGDRLNLEAAAALPRPHYRSFWAPTAVTLLLFQVLVLIGFHLENRQLWSSSYSRGFKTDLNAAKPSIELTTVRFTGGIKFDDRGMIYLNDAPGQPKYVGIPSPEIDQAWDDLLQGFTVDLRGQEASGVVGLTYQNPDGSWESGLDAYHQLHCLDRIRQALAPEYYPSADGPEQAPVHINHCLDYLRQSVMCSADMTPVVTYFEPWINRSSPNFEQVHTCRNWPKLREWAAARHHHDPEGSKHGHGHGHGH